MCFECFFNCVSTHATRAGRDVFHHCDAVKTRCFNSRDPCGSRRDAEIEAYHAKQVSTHATRAGRDRMVQGQTPAPHRFNSRDPCGSRQVEIAADGQIIRFQLTRPVRVATVQRALNVVLHCCFNSRDPCGSRHVQVCFKPIQQLFQLTRPVRVATCFDRI